MTAQLSPLAVQNAALLRAIASGPHDTAGALDAAAGGLNGNLARKLTALIAEGLIERPGEANHQVTLTDLARRALTAIDAFETGPAASPHIDVDAARIDANPFQPRIVVDTAADAEMAASVADKGILQRILVRPHPTDAGRFEQALGHRRVRAAAACGVLVPIEIRDLTDDDMAEIAIIENVQRSDLHWLDEAEAYLTLAARGRSAAQIVRLVGTGGRKKRSIQELIQFARELDADAKARARLPDGDPARISIDAARAMVGHKREKPALDLTPKLAVTLLELLFFADLDIQDDAVVIVLHRKPIGGALITLSDRGLIVLGHRAGRPCATVRVTDDLAKYLDGIGYRDDAAAALMNARAAIIGELAAGALAAEHRYLTPELNPPEGQTETTHPREGGAPGEPEPPLADPDAEFDRMSAAVTAHNPDPDPPPSRHPEQAAIAAVSKDAALVIIELAHKAYRSPAEGPLPSAPVDPSYRHDPLSNQLVFDRMLMFRISGASTIAALTPTAESWLDALGIERGETGCHVIEDEALQYRQLQDGREPPAGQTYVTPWLNDAHKAVEPKPDPFSALVRELLTDDDESPAHPRAGGDLRDGEPANGSPLAAPIVLRLLHANREARRTIEQAASRKLTPDEARTVTALLDAADGDARAAMTAHTPELDA